MKRHINAPRYLTHACVGPEGVHEEGDSHGYIGSSTLNLGLNRVSPKKISLLFSFLFFFPFRGQKLGFASTAYLLHLTHICSNGFQRNLSTYTVILPEVKSAW